MNTVASVAKQSSSSQQQMRIHGRQSLAQVVTLDSTLMLLVGTGLLLSNFDGYDMFFLALHLPHVFTILIAYMVVYYLNGAVDVLRMLVLFYLIAFVVDAFVAIARISMLIHSVSNRDRLVELVRLVVAVVFVLVDIVGALYADMSRVAAYTFALRTDEQLQAYTQQCYSGSGVLPPVVATMEKLPI